MRKFLVLAVLVVGGCCTVPREAADALSANWVLLAPATRKGIEEDATLSPESKVTRLRNVDEFGALIEEVKKNAR
jgi:hypothetical protein